MAMMPADHAHAAVHVRVRRRDRSDGGYVNYVVPGIILLCAGFGRRRPRRTSARHAAGIIDRFRTMPLRAAPCSPGHVVASVLRNLFATAS
jgi:ABC-2 type transport system permease protein